MNQEEVVTKISDNLEEARRLIDEALELGRANDVTVDLNTIGISDDMWYTAPNEWLEDIKADYGEDSEEYANAKEAVANNEAYDDYGYKRFGWMSSSTNC